MSTRASVSNGFATYAPEGAWPEGPVYWSYATDYATELVAALESALGTDWGLLSSAGFSKTGDYRAALAHDPNHTFDFADSHDGPLAPAPGLLFLSRAFQRPIDAATEITHLGTAAKNHATMLDLVFYDPGCAPPTPPSVPVDALFRSVETGKLRPGYDVATFRTAPGDPNGLYLWFKGGVGASSHSHLDVGSFVLDAFGERWADDLGADDYSLPGYFAASTRWTYYRLRTEGHNTLSISTSAQEALHFANQAPLGMAPMVGYLSTPNRAFAVADLTAAYESPPGLVKSVMRGIELVNRSVVVIQDEIEAQSPVEVLSSLHTRATIGPLSDTTTLSQGGVTLSLRILSPAGAQFDTVTSDPTPLALGDSAHRENANKGFTNLVVRLPAMITKARVVVRISKLGDTTPDPTIEPLSSWIAAGPIPP
jgi:hypothetical protein